MDQKELNYLEDTINVIKEEIGQSDVDLKQYNENLYQMQRYAWENASTVDDKEQQYFRREMELEDALELMEYRKNIVLKKMLDNPYFARIDFNNKNIYIGIKNVMDKKYNNYVYDWRAPISNLYYDFELGDAFYNAPEGIIKGNITLKRQYKIENGTLVYMFDNSINIEDDLLREVLSKNTSEKMRNIVNTIQKEQNEVIRNTENEVLIVEGPAGSGKTSVALHRVAYLLYKFREQLKAKEILIFSPNKIFTEYISSVLPELGESNTLSTLFSDYMYNFITEYKDIQTYMEFIEFIYDSNDSNIKEFIEIKLSNNFIKVIDTYIEEIISKIRFKDIYIDDHLIITKETCKEVYNESKRFTPYERIEKVIDYALMKYRHEVIIKNYTLGQINRIIKDNFLYNNNFREILINMYDSIKVQNKLIKLYPNIKLNEFINHSKKQLKGKTINYEDAIIMLYLKGKLQGFGEASRIKQLVLDEAQDYTLMQYIILENIFKKAKVTILGDCNQILNPLLKQDNLNIIGEMFNDKDVIYLKLNTTYRNSYEITELANRILNLKNVNPIKRYTKPPIIKENIDENTLVKEIKDIINNNKYESLSIITKSRKEADYIYQLLKENGIDAHTYESKHITHSKLIILPIYYAKGLEFDNVIIYDNKDNGYKEEDKKIFYVACTRALHELTILSENKLEISF
ncbi:MAG: UvrD-helicase domain-containing protein [Bacilli bacterium]